VEKFWKYGFQFGKKKTTKGYDLYAITDSKKQQFLGTRKTTQQLDKLIKDVVFKTTYG